MSTVTVVVRVRPDDPYKESYHVYFLNEGFIPGDLRTSLGMSTKDFFQSIRLTPKKAKELFPKCCAENGKLSWLSMRTIDGWDKVSWKKLGLQLTAEEFQLLANLLKQPVIRYNYHFDGSLQFVGRTNPM